MAYCAWCIAVTWSEWKRRGTLGHCSLLLYSRLIFHFSLHLHIHWRRQQITILFIKFYVVKITWLISSPCPLLHHVKSSLFSVMGIVYCFVIVRYWLHILLILPVLRTDADVRNVAATGNNVNWRYVQWMYSVSVYVFRSAITLPVFYFCFFLKFGAMQRANLPCT